MEDEENMVVGVHQKPASSRRKDAYIVITILHVIVITILHVGLILSLVDPLDDVLVAIM